MMQFQGRCEIGIEREDLKKILESWLIKYQGYARPFPRVLDLKISPDAKYCIRVTFTHAKPTQDQGEG